MTQAPTRPARNGVDVPTLFATLDAVKASPEIADFRFRARNTWVSGTHNRTTIQGFYGAGQEDNSRTEPFTYDADHPPILVGNNHGPTPVEFLLHAIAACLTSGLANIAAARGVDLRRVESTVEGDIDLLGILGLHHDLESSAGEAHSLQRLAEVHLARGDRQTATRLLRRALPLARWSLIGLHLLHRIFGNMIDAAPDVEAARAVVDRAESTLVEEDRCSFCSIMFAAPAARACADAGDLDDARRYLKAAERSEALWEGTAWQASLVEIRAHIAIAEHHDAMAQRLFGDAAAMFDAAGQPLDAQRCRS